MNSLPGVVEHFLVDFVHTACHRLGKATTTDDCLEVEGYAHALQLVNDELLAKLKLVGDFVELRQLFNRMGYASEQHRFLVLIHSHLG